jgi:hypothetical protein
VCDSEREREREREQESVCVCARVRGNVYLASPLHLRSESLTLCIALVLPFGLKNCIRSRWLRNRCARAPDRDRCCFCIAPKALWRLFQPACVVVQEGNIVGLCGTHKHQFAHHGAHLAFQNARLRVCTRQHGMYLECARRDNVAGRRASALAASGLCDVSSIAQ